MVAKCQVSKLNSRHTLLQRPLLRHSIRPTGFDLLYRHTVFDMANNANYN